ncbi:MAG: helix-turn-helix transcriptional regulator [Patescibacteria group bacterium]|nr:helix-turn-helix transcriptional regulator [Patescibacteria group bacterium]
MKNTKFLHPNTLKEHRLKAGLTQRQVSSYMGFNSEDRISRWEQGQAFPSLQNTLKLAKLFNVHPGELYPELNI